MGSLNTQTNFDKMSDTSENVLVLGASTNPSRYSNKAAKMLKQYQHKPILVGRSDGTIADEPIHDDIPDDVHIDTVTMYLREEIGNQYIDEIIALKPDRVIFNPGAESTEAYQQFAKHKIECIEACTLVMLRTNQF
jgi:predicted CoA-binding protein